MTRFHAVLVDFVDHAADRLRRVVDQDVHPSPRLDCRLRGSLGVGEGANVGADEKRAPARVLDLVRRLFAGGLVDVGDGHRGAGAGELQRARAPDPHGGSGHDGGAVGEVGHVRRL